MHASRSAQPQCKATVPAGGESGPVEPKATGIPVVALGGSAGSLDCFKAFFNDMPADSGAAFVVRALERPQQNRSEESVVVAVSNR